MTDWAGDNRLVGPGIDLIVDVAYPVGRAEELAELSTDWAVDTIINTDDGRGNIETEKSQLMKPSGYMQVSRGKDLVYPIEMHQTKSGQAYFI
uniref:Uncharacterized protein n=1 Tax=Trichuris muris TaxID=70415 RepID=A0A5S6Q5W9_TRIMR